MLLNRHFLHGLHPFCRFQVLCYDLLLLNKIHLPFVRLRFVLIVDHLLGLFAILAFLLNLLLEMLAVSSVSRLKTPHKHLLVFLNRLFSNLLSHLMLINCLVEVLVVTVASLFCSLGHLLLFSVGHFDLMFDNGAPLVQLTVLVHRVVPHIVGGEVADHILFLFKRFFDAVCHFERIHN